MTPTARTVLPTDLVALVSYDGRVYANEAMTLDRIGTHDSPHPLETAFEQWFSFATGRHTWISVKGPTLRGLVSARKRGSRLAWEIDCLINAEDNDNGVLMSLLDQVTEAAGKSGALKIYLRVPSGSALETGAARCAFVPYRYERVYRAPVADLEPAASLAVLRRRTKADMYPLFQLYNAVVPEQVRRAEGATLAEWTAAQEGIGRATQYVCDNEGRVDGLVRVAGDGDIGRFDILARDGELDGLLATAIARIANREVAYALVPHFQDGLARRLEALGFVADEDEYTVLSRRTVRPVKSSATVPVVARTTFG